MLAGFVTAIFAIGYIGYFLYQDWAEKERAKNRQLYEYEQQFRRDMEMIEKSADMRKNPENYFNNDKNNWT